MGRTKKQKEIAEKEKERLKLHGDLAIIRNMNKTRDPKPASRRTAMLETGFKCVAYPLIGIWFGTALLGGGITSGGSNYNRNKKSEGYNGFEE